VIFFRAVDAVAAAVVAKYFKYEFFRAAAVAVAVAVAAIQCPNREPFLCLCFWAVYCVQCFIWVGDGLGKV